MGKSCSPACGGKLRSQQGCLCWGVPTTTLACLVSCGQTTRPLGWVWPHKTIVQPPAHRHGSYEKCITQLLAYKSPVILRIFSVINCFGKWPSSPSLLPTSAHMAVGYVCKRKTCILQPQTRYGQTHTYKYKHKLGQRPYHTHIIRCLALRCSANMQFQLSPHIQASHSKPLWLHIFKELMCTVQP